MSVQVRSTAAAGAGWAVAVDAATFALSATFLVLLRLPKRLVARGDSFVADLRGGWVAFRSRRWVWTVVVYFAASNVLWAAWLALGPIVARDDLGGAAAWGTVLAAAGIGTLVGSLLATHVEPHRPLFFVAVTDALFALPLACLAATPSTLVIAAGTLLASAGMTVAASVWESTLQRRIPGESLSRVSAYDWFGSLVFSAVGLAVWGPIAGAIGVSTTLWLAFGLGLVGIVGLLSIPDVRRMSAAPRPGAASPSACGAAETARTTRRGSEGAGDIEPRLSPSGPAPYVTLDLCFSPHPDTLPCAGCSAPLS
jgi:hypothetical protein